MSNNNSFLNERVRVDAYFIDGEGVLHVIFVAGLQGIDLFSR